MMNMKRANVLLKLRNTVGVNCFTKTVKGNFRMKAFTHELQAWDRDAQ